MSLRQCLTSAFHGSLIICVSPACVAPADRGTAAGCQTLKRSVSGPYSGEQFQFLDVRAAAPLGDYVARWHAGIASVVHSTDTAGRGPAW